MYGIIGVSCAPISWICVERFLTLGFVRGGLLLGEQLRHLFIGVMNVEEAVLGVERRCVVVRVRIVREPAELVHGVLVRERGFRVLVPLGRLERHLEQAALFELALDLGVLIAGCRAVVGRRPPDLELNRGVNPRVLERLGRAVRIGLLAVLVGERLGVEREA